MSLQADLMRAAKQIADDLEINREDIKFDHFESKVGFDYDAQLFEGEKGFDFWVGSESEGPNQKMKASLSVYFQEAVAPYFFQETIDYIVGHSDFLSRWASWAVFKYKQTHEKVALNSIFHDAEIRVYGIPGYCEPAESEADLLFHGVLARQKGKVIIYRFRHVDPPEGYLCRSFSYVIWVSPEEGSPFWVAFPDNCGLEGGASHRAYQHFESLIKMLEKRLEIEIKKYDIPYEELDTFLLEKSTGFHSIFRDSEIGSLLHDYGPSRALEKSEEEFEKFKESIRKKEYARALRDLRALIQQAEENVAKLRKLDLSAVKDPDINKIAAFLIDKNILDGRLRSWFTAFTSIANLASHHDFPTRKDMQEDTLRRRVLLTLHLGMQLLEELDSAVRPKLTFADPNVFFGKSADDKKRFRKP